MGAGLHWLWPTPIGLYRYAGAASLNPLLVAALGEGRAAQQHQRGEQPGPFFASDDDLLHRVKLDEMAGLRRFHRVQSRRDRETGEPASLGRADARPERRHRGHVVPVQPRRSVPRRAHARQLLVVGRVHRPDRRTGAARVASGLWSTNGVTRLYGPPFTTLGGAFVDVGNAYLQPPHQDIEPVPGQLLLFPSWLAHQALPYSGEQERIIISFNASIHGSQGDQMHDYSAH